MGRALRFLRWVLLLVLVALVVWFGGLGPYGFAPGGYLWGEVREPPADWSFTDAIPEIQLETRLFGLPYSVTIWVMSHGGRLFLGASECDRVWVDQVKADPEIRLRVDGRVYEMRAEISTDRALGAALAPVLLHKYLGIAVDSANWIPGENTGCVFRVGPRA